MTVQSTYLADPVVALPGTLDGQGHVVEAHYNSEASAGIPFGRAVKKGASDRAVLLPTTENDKIIGIVSRSHAYSSDELNSSGEIAPNAKVNLVRKGRIWVECEDAVTEGDTGWVRAVAGVGELIGGLLPADDGTDTVDVTNQVEFRTSASAGGYALVEFDFLGNPT